QPRYNVLDRTVEAEHIPACLHHGVGLIPWSPLAGGFLTGKYHRGEEPPEGTRMANSPWASQVLTDRNWDRLERLEAAAAQQGITPARELLHACEIGVFDGIDKALRRGVAERGALCKAARELDRPFLQHVAWHYLQHQPECERFSGVDPPRREDELERALAADRFLEEVAQPVLGNDASLHLRDLEDRVVGRDAD